MRKFYPDLVRVQYQREKKLHTKFCVWKCNRKRWGSVTFLWSQTTGLPCNAVLFKRKRWHFVLCFFVAGQVLFSNHTGAAIFCILFWYVLDLPLGLIHKRSRGSLVISLLAVCCYHKLQSRAQRPYHKWFLSKNLLLRRWLEFTESEIKTRLGSNKTNCKRRRRRRTIEFIHFYIFSFEYKSYHESLLKLVVIIILEDALFFTPQAVWAS